MKSLLWVGDAACPSGFARATHETLKAFVDKYDVWVLGINYRGDPYNQQLPHLADRIYAAAPGGDTMGVQRLPWMCELCKPDVIVLQNDPWNIPIYLQYLKRFPAYKDIPIIGALAVDGKNCAGAGLNELTHGVFWTSFGHEEARDGGFDKPGTVIPLGVDLNAYMPLDKLGCRARKFKTSQLDKAFIVGNVNRNQPRKRLDLSIRYFAKWVNRNKVKDAYLYLHIAPTGDTGVQLKQLANYYGVDNQLILAEPPTFYGDTEEEVVETYNCFDLQINTGQGEGFGLTTLEGMACGVPQIVGDWAALGDWAKGAAWMVPCTSTAVGPPYLNVLGGVPDETLFIAALQAMYSNQGYRDTNRAAGLERAAERQFRWEYVGEQFLQVVDNVLAEKAVAA